MNADTQPDPEGGWSESVRTLGNAHVIPPAENGFVQPAGILDVDGRYCPEGALWRRYRPLTTEPAVPESDPVILKGRWLWGGVLWAHFGHFLVESTSRLWALDRLDRPVDGVLFIPKRPKLGNSTRSFHRDFVHLISPGLPIKVAARPLRVDQLVVPGQGFGLGALSAGTKSFRDAIHHRFAKSIKPDGPEKIYISRSALGLGKGGLLGEERLENLLEADGYDIFHPQKFDIETQIARYKAARHVVAADGSALHLFAMVGRPDQKVAMVMRRTSGANNLLALNVESFCGTAPLTINALRTEWFKKSGKQKSSRLSFGELDHPAIGRALAAGGFVSGGDWPEQTEKERLGMLEEKGITEANGFVESAEFVKKRVREIRRARRVARENPGSIRPAS